MDGGSENRKSALTMDLCNFQDWVNVWMDVGKRLKLGVLPCSL
jgi:hypothetical protein